MRRTVMLAVLIVLGVVFVIRRDSASFAQVTRPQPAPAAADLQSVTLIFGSKDAEPSKWDGSVTISSGSIERIAGYHFDEKSRVLPGNRWECSTRKWGVYSGGMHPNEKPQPQPTPNETCGVTIEFRAPADAELKVTVPKGDFSFRPMDVPSDEGIFPLQASVEITRTPVVRQVTDEEYEDDYPAIAAAGGKVWMAWVAYKDQSDRVFLRSYENGQWGARGTVTEKPGDLFGVAVVVIGGKPFVMWSEREGSSWQLKGRSPGGAVETITSGEGNNLFHKAVADSQGRVHVTWQSARKSRSDIYYRRREANGRWGAEMMLSDPSRHARANDWQPAVTVLRNGTAVVAWDGYGRESYNIYLRRVTGAAAGPIVAVTDSPRFHAHASVAADNQDRVWVAWDEAPDNWGKDTGFLLAGGSGLYEARRIGVAVYEGSRRLAPLQQPDEAMPWGFRRFTQQPRLVSGSNGRVWLFFRPRNGTKLPTTLWAAGGRWEAFATYYGGSRWAEPIVLPETTGRNGGEIAAASGEGGVFAAVVSDHRLWGGPNFGNYPGNNDIMFLRMDDKEPATAQLAPLPPEGPARGPVEPREREQIAALRRHAITAGGRIYHVYRGDMHRHTEISMDGAGDGTLVDAYRYAIDAAGMDYLAVTDHQSGQISAEYSDYTWWRLQKSADMFHTPGFFTGLFGTERSLSYPNGHRNLIFAKRGVPIFHITAEERNNSTGPVLYPQLRKFNGIATSHTSHTNMGTDWRDNDPDLEPIVEIYQGARTSAEQEGAPLSPTGKRTELWAGGYRPLGFVSNAWAKGYKLGVQASSDHVSTHTSYAAIIAENGTREALLDAMRKRHTYAATSNILMDYRVSVDGKTYLQGDIVEASAAPELQARIVGTAALKEVVVMRDNKVIYSNQPAGETYDLRFRENETLSGEHFYYVRAEQRNGHVAWSSPVWVKR
ncbi:MAG: hypothetical protein R2762_03490 [Bryobacteraceae bacterium]